MINHTMLAIMRTLIIIDIFDMWHDNDGDLILLLRLYHCGVQFQSKLSSGVSRSGLTAFKQSLLYNVLLPICLPQPVDVACALL